MKWHGVIIVIITILTAIAVLTIGEVISKKVTDTQSSWIEYTDHSVKLNYYLSKLQQEVGYGGLIHHFKNWILRRDSHYPEMLDSHFFQIKNIITDYRLLGKLNEKELQALDTIETVFEEYEKKYKFTLLKDNLALSPKELDILVRVDDEPAFEAISYLAHSSKMRVSTYENATDRSITSIISFVNYRYLIVILFIVSAALIIFYLFRLYKSNTALLLAESRINTILDVAPQALMLIDEKGIIRRVNYQAERLFECSKDKLEGNIIESVIPEKYRKAHVAHRKSYIDDSYIRRKTGLRREVFILTPEGKEIPVEVSLAQLPDKDEVFIIASIYDLRKRKKHEQEMEEAHAAAELAARAKSTFLANMSHEIRTPMTAIIGLSLLALQSDLPRKEHSYIEKVHNSAKNLLGILNDILDFSKIDSGNLQLDYQPFTINEVFNSIENVLSYLASNKKVKLKYNVDPDLNITLQGDSLRLEQILINLINNAIKFSDPDTEVSISCFIDDIHENCVALKFSITDHGIGIKQEDLDKLFKPFAQADSTTTRTYGGSGLGLAISKKLTELMDGEIWIKSEYGVGSTFYFTVKLDISIDQKLIYSEENAANIDISNEDLSKLYGSNILVVEDNEILQEMILEMLINHGISALIANNGVEALQLLDNHAFDGVLMDCQMPVMDGYMATKKIRQNPKFYELPIIAITANLMSFDKVKIIECGMNDYIGKPLNLAEMFRVMAKWIKPVHKSSFQPIARNKLLTEDASIPDLPGIDKEIGLKYVDHNPEFYLSMLEKYQDYLFAHKQKLLYAKQRNDLPELSKLAHSLKSTSGTFGACEIQSKAQDLEWFCKENQIDDIDKNLPILISEIDVVLNGLGILYAVEA